MDDDLEEFWRKFKEENLKEKRKETVRCDC